MWKQPSPSDLFWRPLLRSNAPVSLCVARSPVESGQLVDSVNFRSSNIAWPDAVTLAKLTGLLQTMGRRYAIRREDLASFDDLRQGPAVLIGAFNDSWTLRLMNDGRFRFRRDGSICWIQDQQNPTDQRWSIDLSHADARGLPILAQDYAIVSRVANPKTGSTLVAVAGLWGYGTEAAGDLLANSQLLAELAARALMDEVHRRVTARYGARTDRVIEAFQRAYPAAKPFDVMSVIFAMPVRQSAITQAERKAAPAFLYLFTWQTPVLNGRPRAFHCSELPFVFDNSDRCAAMTGGTSEARELGAKMSECWINFARKGDPNHSGIPKWAAFAPDKVPTMTFENRCELKNDPAGEARRILLEAA